MRNLIFVGLPGSGKSTVGRLCAKALNLPFVDADKFLEQREGRSVADIFASSGEVRCIIGIVRENRNR